MSCGANFLVIWSTFDPHDLRLLQMDIFAPRTMSAASATNFMNDYVLFDVDDADLDDDVVDDDDDNYGHRVMKNHQLHQCPA